MIEQRRFIEETFPIREISEESAKEKNMRFGYISTLHLWWARRPLAASRATNYASLISVPKDPRENTKKKDFIIKMAKWDNSFDDTLLGTARKEILETNSGERPKILDPFAGGGSIPLEALRLGCETYASDYNPVANLILKCTLEFPQKYGSNISKADSGLLLTNRQNRLLEDVKRWGKFVLEETRKEIEKFYAVEEPGTTPIGYLWARTIPCQNPSCNAEIPLVKQYLLSKKGSKIISLYPYATKTEVHFKVIGNGYGHNIPKNFDPTKGSVSKGIATCLVCGSVVDNKKTAILFREGRSRERMLAAILHKEGKNVKYYRISTDKDLKVFKDASKYLEGKRDQLLSKWGIDPIPDEPTPEGKGRGAERAFGIKNYNMNSWGDLFNSRQKLELIVFSEKVRNSYAMMIGEGYDQPYARSVVSYLALGIDRLADYGSALCVLNPTGGRGVKSTFARPIIQMVWDYVESNPFNTFAAGWPTACEKNEKWIAHSVGNEVPVTVLQSSATTLGFSDEYFDAVFTDPPYYDNVPYSYLSDFFYVWLKRSIGELYPELFATPLTPKAEEIVAYSNRKGGFEAGKQFFEDMLKKSFIEINRVLKPNGICIIVYAHKSAAGWETLVNSLLDSGLVVTAAWPIHTEMKGRLRATESAALASSIYMVARKLQKEQIGFYRNVKDELRRHLKAKLDNLWNEGISGADFFISAIGSSIEVFGKYQKVIDDEENTIRGDKLLEEVRKIVIDYAVKQVLHNGFAADISQMTRLYVLWRWAYGEASVLFDDARKLAQSIGVDLANTWNRGFILKDKEFIRILGPDERRAEELKDSKELIDVLHRVLLLWKKDRKDDIVKVLRESGYGKSDVFYRVAQAISETLPNDSKEKKLLEGFIVGKERISKDAKRESSQKRLFES